MRYVNVYCERNGVCIPTNTVKMRYESTPEVDRFVRQLKLACAQAGFFVLTEAQRGCVFMHNHRNAHDLRDSLVVGGD